APRGPAPGRGGRSGARSHRWWSRCPGVRRRPRPGAARRRGRRRWSSSVLLPLVGLVLAVPTDVGLVLAVPADVGSLGVGGLGAGAGSPGLRGAGPLGTGRLASELAGPRLGNPGFGGPWLGRRLRGPRGRVREGAGQVDGSGVGLLAAVLAGAVAFDGVGHGASPLGGDRHGGVEAVAGMGSGGFEQVMGDGGLVVGIDQGAV